MTTRRAHAASLRDPDGKKDMSAEPHGEGGLGVSAPTGFRALYGEGGSGASSSSGLRGLLEYPNTPIDIARAKVVKQEATNRKRKRREVEIENVKNNGIHVIYDSDQEVSEHVEKWVDFLQPCSDALDIVQEASEHKMGDAFLAAAKCVYEMQQHITDPITMDILEADDMVTIADGSIAGFASMEKWFDQCQDDNRPYTSPTTGAQLQSRSFFPCLLGRQIKASYDSALLDLRKHIVAKRKADRAWGCEHCGQTMHGSKAVCACGKERCGMRSAPLVFMDCPDCGVRLVYTRRESQPFSEGNCFDLPGSVACDNRSCRSNMLDLGPSAPHEGEASAPPAAAPRAKRASSVDADADWKGSDGGSDSD